jgi:uncharacterized BrkB/YihY/UPF0761 family membrane protein
MYSAALAFYGIVSAIPLTIVVMWIVRHRRSQHLRAVAGLRPCPERRANFQDHYATSGLAGIVLLALWLFLSNALVLIGYRVALES